MSYSEKTQRELDRYTRNLVRRQPQWLRRLFDSGQIFFVVEDSGTLGVAYQGELDQKSLDRASVLISKYLDTHPVQVLKPLVVQ